MKEPSPSIFLSPWYIGIGAIALVATTMILVYRDEPNPPDTAAGQAAADQPRPENPAAADGPGTIRILVLGDSLSSAYGMREEQGWVGLIGARLSEAGLDARIINASIAGETTRGGLYRIPGLLEKHRPRLVIIGLGANDGLRGLSLDSMAGNLDKIAVMSLDRGARLIVAAMPIPANYGQHVLDGMHAAYVGVSEARGAALIDFFGNETLSDLDYFQADRLHPNAKAQPLIAKEFWPRISSIVTELAAAGPAAEGG